MPLHPEFQKIKEDFLKRCGQIKGESNFSRFVEQKSLDNTKHFPRKGKESKQCIIKGVEFKEDK